MKRYRVAEAKQAVSVVFVGCSSLRFSSMDPPLVVCDLECQMECCLNLLWNNRIVLSGKEPQKSFWKVVATEFNEEHLSLALKQMRCVAVAAVGNQSFLLV